MEVCREVHIHTIRVLKQLKFGIPQSVTVGWLSADDDDSRLIRDFIIIIIIIEKCFSGLELWVYIKSLLKVKSYKFTPKDRIVIK